MKTPRPAHTWHLPQRLLSLWTTVKSQSGLRAWGWTQERQHFGKSKMLSCFLTLLALGLNCWVSETTGPTLIHMRSPWPNHSTSHQKRISYFTLAGKSVGMSAPMWQCGTLGLPGATWIWPPSLWIG